MAKSKAAAAGAEKLLPNNSIDAVALSASGFPFSHTAAKKESGKNNGNNNSNNNSSNNGNNKS